MFEMTHGTMTELNSSNGVTRGFCGQCGTSVTYEHKERPDEIDITLVTIENDHLLKPEYHLWVSEKLPWIKLDDGMPQFQEWRSN